MVQTDALQVGKQLLAFLRGLLSSTYTYYTHGRGFVPVAISRVYAKVVVVILDEEHAAAQLNMYMVSATFKCK